MAMPGTATVDLSVIGAELECMAFYGVLYSSCQSYSHQLAQPFLFKGVHNLRLLSTADLDHASQCGRLYLGSLECVCCTDIAEREENRMSHTVCLLSIPCLSNVILYGAMRLSMNHNWRASTRCGVSNTQTAFCCPFNVKLIEECCTGLRQSSNAKELRSIPWK